MRSPLELTISCLLPRPWSTLCPREAVKRVETSLLGKTIIVIKKIQKQTATLLIKVPQVVLYLERPSCNAVAQGHPHLTLTSPNYAKTKSTPWCKSPKWTWPEAATNYLKWPIRQNDKSSTITFPFLKTWPICSSISNRIRCKMTRQMQALRISLACEAVRVSSFLRRLSSTTLRSYRSMTILAGSNNLSIISAKCRLKLYTRVRIK